MTAVRAASHLLVSSTRVLSTVRASSLGIHGFFLTKRLPCLPALDTCLSRPLSLSSGRLSSDSDDEEDEKEEEEVVDVLDGVRLVMRRHKVLDIPWQDSIKYLDSEGYLKTYGDKPVWHFYRRNFKGVFPPETRKRCIRKGMIATGSPCPICRDDFLVVDFRNTRLIEQFIDPHSGQLLRSKKTGVCQRAQQYLTIAWERARDAGLIIHDVPFRDYNYNDYYSQEMLQPGYTAPGR